MPCSVSLVFIDHHIFLNQTKRGNGRINFIEWKAAFPDVHLEFYRAAVVSHSDIRFPHRFWQNPKPVKFNNILIVSGKFYAVRAGNLVRLKPRIVPVQIQVISSVVDTEFNLMRQRSDADGPKLGFLRNRPEIVASQNALSAPVGILDFSFIY